jgi:hypothetical protein
MIAGVDRENKVDRTASLSQESEDDPHGHAP